MELPTDQFMEKLQKVINLRNHICRMEEAQKIQSARMETAQKIQSDREHSDLNTQLKQLTELG